MYIGVSYDWPIKITGLFYFHFVKSTNTVAIDGRRYSDNL